MLMIHQIRLPLDGAYQNFGLQLVKTREEDNRKSFQLTPLPSPGSPTIISVLTYCEVALWAADAEPAEI